jgi:hypothetical protein
VVRGESFTRESNVPGTLREGVAEKYRLHQHHRFSLLKKIGVKINVNILFWSTTESYRVRVMATCILKALY